MNKTADTFRTILAVMAAIWALPQLVSADHYLEAFSPVAIFDLEQSPGTEVISGQAGIQSHPDANDLPSPVIVEGANRIPGQGVSFRGTQKYLSFPLSPPVQNLGDVQANQGLSLSFWIKGDASSFATAFQNSRFMGISGDVIEVEVSAASRGVSVTLLNRQARLWGTSPLLDGQWHHVAVTADFSSSFENVRIYHDGVLEATRSMAYQSVPIPSGSMMRLGARSNGFAPCEGELDDVALFSRALSAAEVQALAKGPYGDHVLAPLRPIAIYPFDDAPGTEWISGRQGLLQGPDPGGLHPAAVPGAGPLYGRATDFSASQNTIRFPPGHHLRQSADRTTETGYSLSLWFNSSFENHGTRFLALGDLEIDVTFARGQINARMPGLVVSSNRANQYFDGSWHHYALVFDYRMPLDNVRLYLDGKLEGAFTFNMDTLITGLGMGANETVYLGGRNPNAPSSLAKLDELSVFDHPLTLEEVQKIHRGTFFAGEDQTLAIGDSLILDATTPASASVQWVKESGPGNVGFSSLNDPAGTATFSAPGQYVLRLDALGFNSSRLTVTVLPLQAPEISMPQMLHLEQPSGTLTLQAEATVPHGAIEQISRIRWTQVTGPASTSLSAPSSLQTAATFPAAGLYTLRLEVAANGMTTARDLTVLVGAVPTTHYARALNPLYFLPLDDLARPRGFGVTEFVGNTGAYLDHAEGPLPTIANGARPYTGKAWSLRDTSAAIRVLHRFDIAQFADPNLHDGFSMCFWMKADPADAANGMRLVGLPGHSGLQVLSLGAAGYGLRFSGAAGVLTSTKGVFDGEWHHVALSVRYGNGPNNTKMYIDGVLDQTTTVDLSRSLVSPRLNHSHAWGSDGGTSNYEGLFDDILFFDRELAATDIRYLVDGPTAQQMPKALNEALELDAGPDVVLEDSLRAVRLSATSSEPNSTYRWQLISGPGSVSFSDPAASNPTVSFGPVDQSLVNNPNYLHYVFRVEADSPVRPGDWDEVALVFYKTDAPATRVLAPVPPPGVHPRLLFTAAELPEFRQRYAASTSSQDAKALLMARYETTLLNPWHKLGASYNQLAAGNLDGLDFPTLLAFNPKDSVEGVGGFYSQLAGLAFIYLMEENEEGLEEVAEVFAALAAAHVERYGHGFWDWRNGDTDFNVAFCYDWLFQHMSEDQRTPVRRLLSDMSVWRQVPGVGVSDEENSTNGFGYHSYVMLCAAAIEGEPGYDPRVEELCRRSLRSYMTQHGVFPSGYPHEGWGYHSFSMINASPVILALSRRGENFYRTTNFYANQRAMFSSLIPGQNPVFGHGDTVAGIIDFCPGFVWVARYMFPNDAFIANLAESLHEVGKATGDLRKIGLQTVIFGHPHESLPRAQAAEQGAFPLSLFCKDKGYVNTRTDWSDKGLLLSFRSGSDKYYMGHNHPDVNSFELYSHGLEWFVDNGKFSIKNDQHQTILIDGVGGGGSHAAWTWPSLPGRFVQYTENDLYVSATGDAKAFYDYTHSNVTAPDASIAGHLSFVSTSDHGLTWRDFTFDPIARNQAWRGEAVHFQARPSLHTYNPVQKAIRTTTLVKGAHPFVLVSDDYVKDGALRDYTWVANPRIGTLEALSQSSDTLILKHTDSATARLMVKVLHADGQVGGPRLLSPGGHPAISPNMTPVILEASSQQPEFKLLLYPHEEGDPLPAIERLADGQKIGVQIGDQYRQITFQETSTGRDRILVENPPNAGGFLQQLPRKGANSMSLHPRFQWTPSLPGSIYRLYIWKSGPRPATPFVSINSLAWTHARPFLETNTTYNWQVVVENNSSVLESPVWHFATGGAYFEWAWQNGASYDPTQDSNQNGVPNAIEYFLGGTATTPAAMPKPIRVGGRWTWRLPFDPAAEVSWRLEQAGSLHGSWEIIPSQDQALGLNNRQLDLDLGQAAQTHHLKQFYRLAVGLPEAE